jgi:hypothetical protein
VRLILCKSITAGYGYEQEEILLVMEIVATGDLVFMSNLVKMRRSFVFFKKLLWRGCFARRIDNRLTPVEAILWIHAMSKF